MVAPDTFRVERVRAIGRVVGAELYLTTRDNPPKISPDQLRRAVLEEAAHDCVKPVDIEAAVAANIVAFLDDRPNDQGAEKMAEACERMP